MRFIDDEHAVVPPRDLDQVVQRGSVAIHRIEAFDRDPRPSDAAAFAPAAAPPTTSPGWVLWNGNADDSLVLLSVGCISISGTLGLGLSMVGGVTKQEQLDATMVAYSGVVEGNSAGGNQGSGCRIVSNPTILGTPAYEIIAARDQVSAVSVGSGLVADLKGSVIVPPQFGYALELVAPVGTSALFTVSFKFAKVRLRLG